MNIHTLLDDVTTRQSSDLHLIPGYPIYLRVDTSLVAFGDEVLSGERVEDLIFPIVSAEQKKRLLELRNVDFAYTQGKGRFRVHLYFVKGELAVSIRFLPLRVRSMEELGLPNVFHHISALRQGFVLITGPTGHGKSTSIAAVINEINQTRPDHIVTLEDPIEHVYEPGQSVISQREFGSDFFAWGDALSSALREDPNVVLVGEMRDHATIATALTVAETGHLVLATLHTNSAAQTVDRIIDAFPDGQQAQVRLQLANVLEAIVSQRLVPLIGGGRYVAQEVLLGIPAVKATIREGKSYMLDNIIQTSAEFGMYSLEDSLARLVSAGKVSLEVAQSYSLKPEDLIRLVRGKKISSRE